VGWNMAKDLEVLSSVHNAVRILQEFSLEKKELGISELSERLGLAKSTIFRLVKTLSESHLVEKNEETHKYRLGIGAFELGFMVYHTMDIRLQALPILEKLMKSTRKVVRLGIYDKGGVVYLSKRVPEDDYGTISEEGNRVPSYCTAVGKVLLANQKEIEIERVLSGKLTAFTPKTIVDVDKLRMQLSEVSRTGYATTYEELRTGICSVAVPVYNDMDKVIAAISLTGMKSQFYSYINHYIKELKSYSSLITERLDYY
jgi:IclR family KDG regulon transcriptional repressor